VVQVVKGLQQLRGADGDMEEKDPMQENVGRRKTIQNLHNTHVYKKKQSVITLDTALKRRLSMMPDNSGMYVSMYMGWAIKSSPCTATFNDLLFSPF
jgi:hypothetical protein